MRLREANFDGLVGPTHNYSGLARGNLASLRHRDLLSNPRAAALQGLQKMRRLVALGIPQGVVPPQERPFLPFLRDVGFSGPSEEAVLRRAQRDAPSMLRAACSASAMWTANAATVTPSTDTRDGRVHFTPANLVTSVHRSLEAPHTTRLFRTIFPGPSFVVHDPLPASRELGDEGAANHTRLAWDGGFLHLFVYGWAQDDADAKDVRPSRFMARQAQQASMAVARRHALAPEQTCFLQQHPAAIDAGVFHHDVIGVGHSDYMLVHERAFLAPDAFARLAEQTGGAAAIRIVRDAELSLSEAVATYLFNSQLLTQEDGSLLLLAPQEVAASTAATALIEKLLDEDKGPNAFEAMDLRQSMQNGGGPACLRLRVPLTDAELGHVHSPCLVDEATLDALENWVKAHYRDRLAPEDLVDPSLLEECRRALDALSTLLSLGSVYPFQQTSSTPSAL